MPSFSTDEMPTVASQPMRSLWAAALVGHREPLKALAERKTLAIYAYFRAEGSTPEEAAPRTGNFLARLTSAEMPNPAEEDIDRFQDFLLHRLQAYATEGFPPAPAGAEIVSFDPAQAERRFQREAARPAAEIFHRRWALGILELTIETLRDSYTSEGKAELFALLPPFLSFSGGEERYEEAGKKVAMSASGLRVAVYRFRQRYRETLRQVVGDTVRDAESADGELTKLLVQSS